jgi:hypothetical protein
MYKLKSFPFINRLVCVLKNELEGGGDILVPTNIATPLTLLIAIFQDCSTLMSKRLLSNSPKCDKVPCWKVTQML